MRLCMYCMYVCMYLLSTAGMYAAAFGGRTSLAVLIYFTIFVVVWFFYRSTIIQYTPTV